MVGGPLPAGTLRVAGVIVEASGDCLRIGRRPVEPLAPRVLPVPGTIILDEIGGSLDAALVVRTADYRVPRQAHRAAFDADVLSGPLVVRGRRRGDRFRPFGAPGARRLKAFLIDAKVPRWDRDRLPLVAAGDEILWIAGLRRGAAAPVTPDTARVLELSLNSLAGARATQ
jgi:tRNA(Ile)-lysidine synthase